MSPIPLSHDVEIRNLVKCLKCRQVTGIRKLHLKTKQNNIKNGLRKEPGHHSPLFELRANNYFSFI